MKTPSLFEIGSALRVHMGKSVGKSATVLPPGVNGNPDAKDILVIHAVNPGDVSGAEMGGPEALARQSGIYNVTLSYPRDDLNKANASWDLAQRLMAAFYRRTLATADGCAVFIEEPYTTNVGQTPDKRLALAVAVPWWAWAGGYEEEI